MSERETSRTSRLAHALIPQGDIVFDSFRLFLWGGVTVWVMSNVV